MINGMLVHFKSHPRKFPEHFARGCPGIHFHKALEITGSTVAKDRPLRRTYGWFSLRGDRSVPRAFAQSYRRKTHTCAMYIRNWHTRSPRAYGAHGPPFQFRGRRNEGAAARAQNPHHFSSSHNTRFPRVLLAPSIAFFPSLVGPNSPLASPLKTSPPSGRIVRQNAET